MLKKEKQGDSIIKNSDRISTYDDIFCQNESWLHLLFQYTNLKLECVDTEQDIVKLPPPYIFGEGIRGKNKKNATCLDYKARLVGRDFVKDVTLILP